METPDSFVKVNFVRSVSILGATVLVDVKGLIILIFLTLNISTFYILMSQEVKKQITPFVIDSYTLYAIHKKAKRFYPGG